MKDIDVSISYIHIDISVMFVIIVNTVTVGIDQWVCADACILHWRLSPDGHAAPRWSRGKLCMFVCIYSFVYII